MEQQLAVMAGLQVGQLECCHTLGDTLDAANTQQCQLFRPRVVDLAHN